MTLQIYDKWGNVWLDFTSTIFVANAGHANKRIIKGLKTYSKSHLHTYTYLSAERLAYLEYLIENTPAQFEKAFLLSAGTEATEVSLKLMLMKGQLDTKTKVGVICFSGAYHGRTMGAQFMNGPSPGRDSLYIMIQTFITLIFLTHGLPRIQKHFSKRKFINFWNVKN